MATRPTFSTSPLRVYRTSRSLSQLALGELVGVSKVSICHVEKGRTKEVSKATLHRIAEELDIEFAALFPDLADKP